jgi:putative membrane protein
VVDVRPLLPIAGIGAAYAIGLRRIWATAGPGRLVRVWEGWCFGAGLVVTAAALAGPMDSAAHRSFSAHMIQHVLLLSVAGPLLALGAPFPTLLWVLSGQRRQSALRAWRRLSSSHTGVGWYVWVCGSIVLTSAVMWGWHAPVLYQAALSNDAVHGLEHLTFVSVSMLQWWALAGGHRARRGPAVLAVFIASFPATALGAAMLLAPRPWYADYIRTTVAAALSDQQVAGVVMWAFGGLIYVVGAAVLLYSWLNVGHADELPVHPLPMPRMKEVS